MTAIAPLRSVIDAYVFAYRTGDAAACAACFTDDATLLSPYAPPARGRDAVAALHAEWVSEGAHKTMEILDCGMEGAIAWALARYAEGDATGTGTSLCVFRNQPDGGWLIHMCSLNETDPV